MEDIYEEQIPIIGTSSSKSPNELKEAQNTKTRSGCERIRDSVQANPSFFSQVFSLNFLLLFVYLGFSAFCCNFYMGTVVSQLYSITTDETESKLF
jgi:hypothetical protein